jgi:hypothetical protein
LVVQRSTGNILVGNHRYMAAKAMGLTELPVLWIDVDDERAERILLADNRLSDLATYDDAGLAALLKELNITETGLKGTGYSVEELEELLAGLADEVDSEAEREDLTRLGILERDPVHVCERGQIWLVGKHVLFVMSPFTGWPHFKSYMEQSERDILVPWATPAVPLTERANGPYRLLMIQPDALMAGTLLDRFAGKYGEKTLTLVGKVT